VVGHVRWATLAFVLWNALTIWWIWYATPVGPPAATLASTTMNMIAFMLFHTVSKKAPKALAYVTLVTAWITTEYWYTVGDFSWPWLILGNGFSHELRSVAEQECVLGLPEERGGVPPRAEAVTPVQAFAGPRAGHPGQRAEVPEGELGVLLDEDGVRDFVRDAE
jgi:hypothetical protein